MAAPGTPKAWVTPSFSITSTAAIAAFIFAMIESPWVFGYGAMVPAARGQGKASAGI